MFVHVAHVQRCLWGLVESMIWAVDPDYLFYMIDFEQEYVPEHSGVAPKLSWEMEQQLGYPVKADIARWPDQVLE